MSAAATITGETRDKIVEMLARRPAVSFARIADFYGVSIYSVEGIARANGFTGMGRPK